MGRRGKASVQAAPPPETNEAVVVVTEETQLQHRERAVRETDVATTATQNAWNEAHDAVGRSDGLVHTLGVERKALLLRGCSASELQEVDQLLADARRHREVAQAALDDASRRAAAARQAHERALQALSSARDWTQRLRHAIDHAPAQIVVAERAVGEAQQTLAERQAMLDHARRACDENCARLVELTGEDRNALVRERLRDLGLTGT